MDKHILGERDIYTKVPREGGAVSQPRRGKRRIKLFFTKKRRISRSAAKAIRQPRDRLKRQPQERQHSAAVFGGTRDRLPPGEGCRTSCVRDRSPSGPKPPLGGFGSREPDPEGGTPILASQKRRPLRNP